MTAPIKNSSNERGYAQDPVKFLQKTFEEIEGYDEMIVLRGIRFESHCEHHMAPITLKMWRCGITEGENMAEEQSPSGGPERIS